MRRRELMSLLGAAMAVPRVSRAQNHIPVVGILDPRPSNSELVTNLRRGLAETGYRDGQNVIVKYHGTDGNYDHLPAMAAELVRDKVAVIIAVGLPTVAPAKAATTTIPIVFMVGDDPVKHGLVASFARPGSNITGLSMLGAGLEAKRLQLMRDLVPKLNHVGLLLNTRNATAESQLSDVRGAAQGMALALDMVSARDDGEIDAGFAKLAAAGVQALLVGTDPFFTGRRRRIVDLAQRYRLPGVYEWREFADEGGLASYGSSRSDNYYKVGLYAGKILAGAKPADLPIMQPTKFELIINLKTAKALGLTVPQALLQRADDVIE